MQAIFAAGCFWHVEEIFSKIPGVIKTEVGYMGGHIANPTYAQVCTGTTGHAEAIKIEYNPEVITYETLLGIFWQCHNPTTLNRQGPDIGAQYRSAIFYVDELQKKLAELSKEYLGNSRRYSSPVVTAIEPANSFYRAEEYHQQYFEKQGGSKCSI